MNSTHPELSAASLAERHNRRRRIAAAMLALSLLAYEAPPLAADTKPSGGYNLMNIFPNFKAARLGLHLEGKNYRLSSDNNRAVLWYEGDPSLFIQHATDPADPNSRCEGDTFSWQNHQLVYKESIYNCDQDNVYSDGIVFAPDHWDGGKWSVKGTTNTLLYKDGATTPECYGTNQYHSFVVGETTIPTGQRALHIRIIEDQKWSPVDDNSPPKECPNPEGSESVWYENYFWTKSIPEESADGSVVGSEPGLAESIGGDSNPAGTHWNTQMKIWQPNANSVSTRH